MNKTRFIKTFVFLMYALTLPVTAQNIESILDAAVIKQVKDDLIKQHGESQRFRVEKGVDQVARLWLKSDGSKEDFTEFCKQNFIGKEDQLEKFFVKLEFYNEILNGYYTEMVLDMNQPLSLDWGELLPIDMAMASYNPSAHISDDFFENKIAFMGMLNFPTYKYDELVDKGPKWSRKDWAYARMGGGNNTRIPASVNQKANELGTQTQRYVYEYNIAMGNLVDDKFKTFFPKEMKLISHWGLRDELKARYAAKEDLAKQQLIYQVMQRIIRQDIPLQVINSNKYQWNPMTNKVFENGKEIATTFEPDTRYANLLKTFESARLFDLYNHDYPTAIGRSFELGREIPEKEIESMFTELLSSQQARKAAKLVEKRLGRKLQPFDIWYNGFQGTQKVAEEELDKIVAQKYPTIEAFENDIENILVKLDFSKEDAAFIAGKIRLDPARGAGHCAGAQMKNYKSRIRARIPKAGMNYKGYNTVMHELGHAVEQTLNLYKSDYYVLRGVPNVAFTEAFAFVFQDRSIDLLGVKMDKQNEQELKSLDLLWSAYEIMGVSLVDMKVWRWMYEHPKATPAELKIAVADIAKEVWNKYYADVYGVKDQVVLAVYSHMIYRALYLPDYAIGNVIQFQLEDYLKDKKIGVEMPRMIAAGNIIPQLWMKNAVSHEISVKPLLQSVDKALTVIKN